MGLDGIETWTGVAGMERMGEMDSFESCSGEVRQVRRGQVFLCLAENGWER